jgi:ectoine hydroxylase-related dioxygenase (phytanoyl-CoA dioxygenase family)
MIADKLLKLSDKKRVFTAEKGDLLIWHANLFHGGEPHLNKAKTRKSMVLHYFATDRICYHEITQRPTLIG